MANVRLKNINKLFTNKEEKKKWFTKNKSLIEKEAVNDFTLDIKDGEFVVFVGPSGCGKTTTLRMIAGLEEITSGDLYIDDVLVNDMPPKDRDIAMVFQSYALYPHMSVYENLAFSLKMKKLPKEEIDQKVKEAAEILEISDLLERKPKQLSGGQRQRVAIGRAIVRKPKVLLMDEPLSNLDAKLRNQTRAELIKLHNKLKITIIYVTHDQVEAMTLADKIVVMKDGYIQQIGAPQEIFYKPQNRFVAEFIGSPKMNIFENSKLEKNGDNYSINLEDSKLKLTAEQCKKLQEKNIDTSIVSVGVRPTSIRINEGNIKANISLFETLGSEVYLHLSCEGNDIVCVVPNTNDNAINYRIGNDININFNIGDICLFDDKDNNLLA